MTFHKYRPKVLGDRVKIPRHAADERRGYYYGTVIHGHRTFDGFALGGPGLIVEWDEPVPYLGKFSETIVAISDMPDPVWGTLDAWKDARQLVSSL
jgi:hypothetical protein